MTDCEKCAEKDIAMQRQQTLLAERSNRLMIAEKELAEYKKWAATLPTKEIFQFGEKDGDGFSINLRGATLDMHMWWDSACVGTSGDADAVAFLAKFPPEILRAALEKCGL